MYEYLIYSPAAFVRTKVNDDGGQSTALNFKSHGKTQGAKNSGSTISEYSDSGGQQFTTVGLNVISSGVAGVLEEPP